MSLSINKFKSVIWKSVRRTPYISLLLTLAAVLIHLSYSLRLQLLYDRSAMHHHELWRLLTCHWVHLSWDHLFWSATTFLCLGSLCELINRKKYLVTVGISAFLIPAAVWWCMPDLIVYGGLSGIDCALYALLINLLLKREMRSGSRVWLSFFLLLLVGLIAKISYEAITGMTIFVGNNHSGMVPVPLAHLVGGLVGTAIGVARDSVTSGTTCQQKQRYPPFLQFRIE